MNSMDDRVDQAHAGTFQEPALAPEQREEASMPYVPGATLPAEPESAVERARQALQRRLADVAGVTGITRDQDPIGNDILVVYVQSDEPSVRALVPATVNGVRIEVRTGEFFALAPER